MPILHRTIAVTNVGKTPLMDAIIKEDADQVNALIAKGINVNEQDEHGWTALQLAAAYGRGDIVDALLANKRADPNIKNSVGRTALMYAAALGYTSIVEALLTAGADPNATWLIDPENTTDETSWMLAGETSLMLAAWSGHSDIISLLIKAGADVNAKGGPLGGTALHSALWEGFANSIQALLKAPKSGLEPNRQLWPNS